MNRVQTVTQKHYRVEKPGQKPSQVHEHQNWPSWAHRRAQARAWPRTLAPCRRQLWPWPSAMSQGPASCRSAPLAISWACARRVVGAAAPCVARDPNSLPLAQPQYTLVYCDTPPDSSSHYPSCCVMIQFLCIKTQSLNLLAFLLQYSLCLAI